MSVTTSREAEDRDELQATLEFAVQIAREASDLTLGYFRQSRNKLVVDRKADGSFVTTADREAEQLLRARIAERFPADAVLGEEEGERAGSSGRRWIVDPIDGTYSFVHGVPLWGVLVGLEINGEAALGVVSLPALDEIVYARTGGGCFWNGEPAHVTDTPTLDDALLLSTDFGACARYGFGDAAGEMQRRAHSRRTWGDAYGHVLVATGRADVMLDPAMNAWDCAALLPIIEEAGGTFTDWCGARTIHGGNAISTNGALFAEVVAIAAES